MRVLVINEIGGRLDRLQAVIEHMQHQDISAVFVLGNLLHPMAQSDRAEALLQILNQFGNFRIPIYLIPGRYDAPFDALVQAHRSYRGETSIMLVHRTAASYGLSNVVAGFGGQIAPTESLQRDQLHYADWEARLAFEQLAAHHLVFQRARRRLFLFAMPPHGSEIDLLDGQHMGSETLNWIIRIHRPELVCCAGPAAANGTELIEGALVVNPGSLADGSYAVIDLDPLRVQLARLPQTPAIPTELFRSIVAALDGSPASWHACELATRLAQQVGAQLTMVHAVARVPASPPQHAKATDMQSSADAELCARAARLAAAVHFVCVLREGTTIEAALDVARVDQADLLVLGTPELSTISSILERVVDRSPCPVLIAPLLPMTVYEEVHASGMEGGTPNV